MSWVPKWDFSKPNWSENQHMTIYDVPQIGNWVGRVGHVIDILGRPCQAEMDVMVYAVWANAPRLLLALYKPDRLDLVTQRWQGGHKSRNKRKFKIIDELAPKTPVPKGAGWAMWTIAGDLAQKIGYYVMVVDATTDFAVHWTSTAYALAGCKVPGTPYTKAHLEENVLGPYAAGRYKFDFWHVDEAHVFSADAASISIPNGYIWSASAGFAQLPLNLPIQEAAVSGIELVNSLTGDVLAECEMRQTHDGQHAAMAVYRRFDAVNVGAHLETYITKSDGFYRTGPAFFQSYGDLSNGLNPDP